MLVANTSVPHLKYTINTVMSVIHNIYIYTYIYFKRPLYNYWDDDIFKWPLIPEIFIFLDISKS